MIVKAPKLQMKTVTQQVCFVGAVNFTYGEDFSRYGVSHIIDLFLPFGASKISEDFNLVESIFSDNVQMIKDLYKHLSLFKTSTVMVDED